MTDTQYERAVALASAVKEKENVSRYVRFLVEWSDLRGNDFTWDRHYAREWADRFNKHVEYLDAAGDALIALVHVDGAKKALDMYTTELAWYNGIPRSKAKAEAKVIFQRAYESQNTRVPDTFKGYKAPKKTKRAPTKRSSKKL